MKLLHFCSTYTIIVYYKNYLGPAYYIQIVMKMFEQHKFSITYN